MATQKTDSNINWSRCAGNMKLSNDRWISSTARLRNWSAIASKSRIRRNRNSHKRRKRRLSRPAKNAILTSKVPSVWPDAATKNIRLIKRPLPKQKARKEPWTGRTRCQPRNKRDTVLRIAGGGPGFAGGYGKAGEERRKP